VDAGEKVTLQWSGDLTIRRIAELKVQIEEALATATHVSIEIAADAESDMTVLQLLCAAHRTAARQDKTLQLCGKIPEQFKMVMNLAGFSRHIGCARDKAGCCMWKLVYQQLDEQSSLRPVVTN
jgi:ABC-type transporter Mla MlaB component